jgi:membrane associated rhomboid family serine protease
LIVVIVVNLVIGFFPGVNISWQAHVGGLVVGAAVALVYTRTRNRTQRALQVGLVAGIGVALAAIMVLRVSGF